MEDIEKCDEPPNNTKTVCMEKPDSTKYQYSRDTLCDLSNSAAAKVRPECLSSDFNGLDGIWDPERWHMYLSGKRSRGPSPNQLIENGKRPIDSDREFYRSRRPSDAKERIKEERDGIILSPQRRSFGHGCQVSAQIFQRRGSGSPLENKDSGDGHGSSNLGSQRRIGSGRLASRTRSVEYENKDRQGRDYEHEKETRFERYSSNRRITRSEGRRMRQEEEPEWYSAGPSSQSETIELRGFHKEDLKDVRDSSYKQNRVKSHDGSFETHTSSSPETSQEHDTSGPVPEEKTFDINQFFSLTDTFPGLNDAVTPDIADISQTSRFSQWFSTSGVRSHNSSCSGSRRSTPNEELVFLHELSGRRSPLIPSPTPEGSLFLPITPPNDKVKQQAFLEMLQRANINIPKTTVQLNEQNLSGKVKSVAELEAELNGMVIGNNNRNKRPDHHAHHRHHHNTVMNTDIQQPQTFTDKPQTVNLGGDMSAFDKLVFNMKVSGSLPEAAKPVIKSDGKRVSPIHILSLEKNKTVQIIRPEPEVNIRPPSVSTPPRQDPVITLQQPPTKMTQQTLSPSPMVVPQMGRLTPVSGQKEFLQELAKNNQMPPGRPFSPNLLAFTPQQQQQLLKTMAMNQRSVSPCQELLGTLLKHQQNTLQRSTSPQEFLQVLRPPPSSPRIASPLSYPGNRAASPLPPPSPGLAPSAPPNTPSSIPRVPSPQELVAHTQSIYQQALIKKQLEVQKEKYMAREAARAKSPIPMSQNMHMNMNDKPMQVPVPTCMSTPQRTMLTAFTPTSVIRKMHESKAEQSDKDGPSMAQVQGNNVFTAQQRLKPLDHSMGNVSSQNQLVNNMDGPAGGHQQPPLSPMNHVPHNVPVVKLYQQPSQHMQAPQYKSNQQGPYNQPPPPPSSYNQAPPSPYKQAPSSPYKQAPPSPYKQGPPSPYKQAPPSPYKQPPYNQPKIPPPYKQQQPQVSAFNQQPCVPKMQQHHSPVHQLNKDISGDIDYNKIREVQLQQQQKAAAVEGQNSMGPMQMHPCPQPPLPVSMIPSRMPAQQPLLRGVYPGISNVRNVPNMPLQQGNNPRPMQQQVPLIVNPRSPFPCTSSGAISQTAATAAAIAAMQAQAGLQRSLSQNPKNSRPDLPNTPPSVNTGLFSQSVNAPIMSQRSQSPVNLTKWFGTDVLRQPLPQMPPMIHHGKNVLSVEDIECHQ